MPTSSSVVSYNNQTCPTVNSPANQNNTLMGQKMPQQLIPRQDSYGHSNQPQHLTMNTLETQFSQGGMSANELGNNGNGSIIDEMHYQKGMTLIK